MQVLNSKQPKTPKRIQNLKYQDYNRSLAFNFCMINGESGKCPDDSGANCIASHMAWVLTK